MCIRDRRQPGQLQRDDRHQQHPEGEFGHRVHGERHGADQPVDQPPLVPGGQHAEPEAERDEQGDGERGQQQARAEAVGDVVGDRAAGGQRGAEVAVQEARRPVGQTCVGGPVQLQGLADRRDARGVGLVAREGHGGVAREGLGEGEDQQHHGHGLGEAEDEPPGDERPQAALFHASHTLSKRAQSRVLAGALVSTPLTLRAVPRIQSAKPQTRKPPSAYRRRCIRS